MDLRRRVVARFEMRQRVVARYLSAKPISDLQQGLPAFRAVVDTFTRNEDLAKTEMALAQQ